MPRRTFSFTEIKARLCAEKDHKKRATQGLLELQRKLWLTPEERAFLVSLTLFAQNQRSRWDLSLPLVDQYIACPLSGQENTTALINCAVCLMHNGYTARAQQFLTAARTHMETYHPTAEEMHEDIFLRGHLEMHTGTVKSMEGNSTCFEHLDNALQIYGSITADTHIATVHTIRLQAGVRLERADQALKAANVIGEASWTYLANSVGVSDNFVMARSLVIPLKLECSKRPQKHLPRDLPFFMIALASMYRQIGCHQKVRELVTDFVEHCARYGIKDQALNRLADRMTNNMNHGSIVK